MPKLFLLPGENMKLEQIEKCIKEYGDGIYRFCYFLTGSREAADDLYQESFLDSLHY